MEVLKPNHFLQHSPDEHPQECLNDAQRSSASDGHERIAERVGLSTSAVARACKAAAVARFPALQETVPVRRHEHASLGELLRPDTRKLGRFDKPGQRVTSDRTQNTPRGLAGAARADRRPLPCGL